MATFTNQSKNSATFTTLLRAHPISTLSVTNKMSAIEWIAFSPDGTRLYIGDTDSPSAVHQYSLSTAWDITTASFVQSKTFTGTTYFESGFWKSDGTKFFAIDSDVADYIREYTISPAWDISTASLNNSLSITAADDSPFGLFFKSDGLKLFLTGDSSDEINYYALSTPWDISTAVLTSTLNISPQLSTPEGIAFNSTGTKLYVIHGITANIAQWNLSTAWDITTASFYNYIMDTSDTSSTTGLFMGQNDATIFISDTATIKQFPLIDFTNLTKN
jgi:DNA-binding beta-propeller fold protein YncE